MTKKLRSVLFIPVLLLLFTVGCTLPDESPSDAHKLNVQTIDPLVTAEWLSDHLDDPDLVIIDATVEIQPDEDGQIEVTSGKAGYLVSHIPGARFADLTGDLADGTSPYPYALPSPVEFAEAMGALGVGDDSRVVIYARNYSAWATRVWWMLQWIGFDNVAVLDGGFEAWTAAGLPVEGGPSSAEVKSLSVSLQPTLIADRDEVFAAISDPEVMLIDAMPAEHFRGEMQMYKRKGHIPTAINIPTVFKEDGTFMSLSDLVTIHDTNNISEDKSQRIITYCGGGISASANAFAMTTLLGFDNVAVYIGSLEEWSDDDTNPMTVAVDE